MERVVSTVARSHRRTQKDERSERPEPKSTPGSPADVPTTHIYSRTDGVVHWESCIDLSGAPRVENVEVMGSHVGMRLNVEAYRVIADRLAPPRRSRRNQVIHTSPPRGVDFRRLR